MVDLLFAWSVILKLNCVSFCQSVSQSKYEKNVPLFLFLEYQMHLPLSVYISFLCHRFVASSQLLTKYTGTFNFHHI